MEENTEKWYTDAICRERKTAKADPQDRSEDSAAMGKRTIWEARTKTARPKTS